jgi:hypothetical protein
VMRVLKKNLHRFVAGVGVSVYSYRHFGKDFDAMLRQEFAYSWAARVRCRWHEFLARRTKKRLYWFSCGGVQRERVSI